MSEAGFPEVGSVIDGRYEILKLLGMGGMGAVYKAAFKQLGGRIVALKVLKPDIGDNDEFRKRFEREAEIAARLQHPCIVQVSDFGQLSNGLLYMALEYIEGQDLYQVLKETRGGLPVARAVKLMSSILDALALAHEHKIIHRDLKPQNVMVQSIGGGDHVKILDFGIAKIENEDLTMPNQILGTVSYMSPEQSRAQPIDGRSDIYATGIMLYEMLTGELPFRGQTAVEIIKQHRKAEPRNPLEIKPELPPALAGAILKAVKKDPNERFQTAKEFLAAIEAASMVPLGDADTVPGGTPSNAASGEGTASSYLGRGTMTSYGNLEGRVLDNKYEVIAKLGEGGMGAVYKARNKLLGLYVALKVMHPSQCEDVTIRERFIREVKAMSGFTHPNAITVREFVQSQDGFLYMTMDYSEGVCLKDLLQKKPYLPVERALNIARQVLSALAEGHRNKIVHRDIKPDNILIEDDEGDDHVKVLDFGIAKIMEKDDPEAESLTGRHVIGTPSYMSPEQASGEQIDARTDLYAVGCVLYEMLSGEKVFSGTTVMETLMAHVTKPPVPVHERNLKAKIPAHVSDLVSQALAKEPGERISSAKEFIKKIEAILDGRSPAEVSRTDVTMLAEISYDSDDSAEAPATTGKKSSMVLPLALGAVILLLAAFVGGLALNLDGKQGSTDSSALATLTDKSGQKDGEDEIGKKAPENIPTKVAEKDPVNDTEPKDDPKPEPTPEPKPEPSKDPDPEPVKKTPELPKPEPTKEPTTEPKVEPKSDPVKEPLAMNPKKDPVLEPKPEPTKEPTTEPKVEPDSDPVKEPAVTEPKKVDVKDVADKKDPTVTTPVAPPKVEPMPKKDPVPPVTEPEPKTDKPELPPLPPVKKVEDPEVDHPKLPEPKKVDPGKLEPVEPSKPETKVVSIPKPEPKKLATPGLASVAVLPFSIRNETVDESFRGLVWKIGVEKETSILTAVMTRKLVKTGKFDVVERSKVDAAIREQNFGQEGRSEPSRAVKFGSVIGADYLILGEITELSVARKSIDAGRLARVAPLVIVDLKMEVELRVLDARTTKVVEAQKISATVRQEGRGLGPLRVIVASQLKTLKEQLIDKIVWTIVDDVYPLKVTEVSDAGIVLNRGSNAGMKVGQVFDVYKMGEPIIDRDTKQVLGHKKKKVGQIRVTSVEKRYAQASVIEGQIEDSCVCKKVEEKPAKAESKPSRKRPWGRR